MSESTTEKWQRRVLLVFSLWFSYIRWLAEWSLPLSYGSARMLEEDSYQKHYSRNEVGREEGSYQKHYPSYDTVFRVWRKMLTRIGTWSWNRQVRIGV